MSFHRIKKYSRQVVCQDMILSCQSNHIEEIPLLKRAQVSGVSLRNQRGRRSEQGRSTWLERDLYLSSILMCWHLWNTRSVPLSFSIRKRAGQQRQTGMQKIEKGCQSLYTLRDNQLYTAIEKYLLFLMPREIRKKRYIHSLHRFSLYRDRLFLSACYVDTALGLCQYNLENSYLQSVISGWKNEQKNVQPTSFTLLSERIRFPSQSIETNRIQDHTQDPIVNTIKKGYDDPRACDRRRRNLSLYCPSLLTSPDIQDIAQSGLITLEGSLTLELF